MNDDFQQPHTGTEEIGCRRLFKFGGFAIMKALRGLFLAVLLLCNCSQRRTVYLDQTVNLLANKDIVVENYILNVKQRDGNSLAGIRIVRNDPDGKETIITSNTSTVMQGPPNYIETASENSKDHDRLKVVVIHNSLNLTLFNALVQTKSQSGTTRLVVKRMDLNF